MKSVRPSFDGSRPDGQGRPYLCVIISVEAHCVRAKPGYGEKEEVIAHDVWLIKRIRWKLLRSRCWAAFRRIKRVDVECQFPLCISSERVNVGDSYRGVPACETTRRCCLSILIVLSVHEKHNPKSSQQCNLYRCWNEELAISLSFFLGWCNL